MKKVDLRYILGPEDVLEKIKQYFNKERRFIFIFTFILGILTHFLLLSKTILSQDGLWHIFHYTSGTYEATLGRWGIDFFDSLRNDIALPFITTLISIIIMGFINILIIEILEIKSKVSKIISAITVVVSPSLCMTLLYAYTADVYYYACFLSVFTVYAFYRIRNKKLGTILGIISFIITLSTYQSYMGITVGLILMISIKTLLTEKKSTIKVINDIVIKAIILIISAILYFFITIALLKILKLDLAPYGGANTISLSTIFKSIIVSIKKAYIGFIKYFFADGVVLNRAWKRDKLFLIFFAITAIEAILLFIKNLIGNKEKKEVFIRFIFSGVLVLCLPIALNLVIIIASGNEIYYLTSTQMLLMIPFSLMLFELVQKDVITNILNWGAVVVSFMIITTYFISISVTYQTAEMAYEQAKAISIRVLNRIEECPGYRAEMPKLFAGIVDDNNFPKILDIYNYAITNSLRGTIFHRTYWGQGATWNSFMNTFLRY